MNRLSAYGLAGLALTHVGPAATWLPSVRRLLPSLAGIGDSDHVALTFDDGPDELSTPWFLDVLDQTGRRATFFLLGEMVHRHPEMARRLVATGHEVGVHGWWHENALLTPPGRLSWGLRRAVGLITEVTGVRPRWYRPPYGVLTAEGLLAARALGLRPVLWTAWGRDWTAAATPGSVLAKLRPDVRGGATVLLHDSDSMSAPGAWRSALGALPPLLGRCEDAGLAVGPLRDHGIG